MIIYLASPYSHPEPVIRAARAASVSRIAGRLLAKGIHVYSPIAHTHGIAELVPMPTDWEFWKQFDEKFIRVCGELWIAMIDGWEQSVGVAAEFEIARDAGIPTRFVDPITLNIADTLAQRMLLRRLRKSA